MEMWQEERALHQNPRGARGQRILGKVVGTKRVGVGELDATGQGGRGHLVKEVLSGRRLRFRFYSCLSRALSVPDLTCSWASSMQVSSDVISLGSHCPLYDDLPSASCVPCSVTGPGTVG